MRPIWKGSISFGLVYIPVAVYSATREEKLSFRQLRSSDLSPIKYKKVAEADSKEVPADQIVKGFEFERGHYVVMKDEDFEKVRIESTHSIDITDFIDLEQVDPKFFYKPYFLEPQKGGEKAYAVLHKALSGTGKIGVAKVVISNREHLAAVKPDGLFLILELMHFASEILSADGGLQQVLRLVREALPEKLRETAYWGNLTLSCLEWIEMAIVEPMSLTSISKGMGSGTCRVGMKPDVFQPSISFDA